jgi:hypothetical protein
MAGHSRHNYGKTAGDQFEHLQLPLGQFGEERFGIRILTANVLQDTYGNARVQGHFTQGGAVQGIDQLLHFHVFRNLYNPVQDKTIREKALELIETEEGGKYRNKYVSLWRGI